MLACPSLYRPQASTSLPKHACFGKSITLTQLSNKDRLVDCPQGVSEFGWVCCRHVLNGRRCFKQEPDVDYDVDSDEDWQEEPEDGESLSVQHHSFQHKICSLATTSPDIRESDVARLTSTSIAAVARHSCLVQDAVLADSWNNFAMWFNACLARELESDSSDNSQTSIAIAS